MHRKTNARRWARCCRRCLQAGRPFRRATTTGPLLLATNPSSSTQPSLPHSTNCRRGGPSIAPPPAGPCRGRRECRSRGCSRCPARPTTTAAAAWGESRRLRPGRGAMGADGQLLATPQTGINFNRAAPTAVVVLSAAWASHMAVRALYVPCTCPVHPCTSLYIPVHPCTSLTVTTCVCCVSHVLRRYEDFVYFILSEEDKSTDASLDYWFRCVGLRRCARRCRCRGGATPSRHRLLPRCRRCCTQWQLPLLLLSLRIAAVAAVQRCCLLTQRPPSPPRWFVTQLLRPGRRRAPGPR